LNSVNSSNNLYLSNNCES